MFVGTALTLAVLTSPFLEDLAADQPSPDAVTTVAATPETTIASAAAPTPTSSAPTEATVPATASSTVAGTAPLTAPVATSPLDPDWKAKISPDYVVRDAGCATDMSAAGLDAFFTDPLGPIMGFDEPRQYPLGDGRTLWALQDAFVDETGGADSFAHMGYANSMMLIQDGLCFTSLRRGTDTVTESFEPGFGPIDFDRYFWPAGGSAANGVLQMFWMEMIRDPKVESPFDGIALHPASTWLATYDIATMQRLSFVPAPNPGVSPVVGYHVVADGDWDYLFGNSYLQNLELEGGYANGPHSATNTYLARVAHGHLDAAPEYWDGSTWNSDASAAAPISSRNWTENLVMPAKLGERWVSATKVDGFLGNSVTVDVADEPWGPWATVATLPSTPRGDPMGVVTYHAAVLPFTDPSGAVMVTLSQIPIELGRTDAPPKYRPNILTIGL